MHKDVQLRVRHRLCRRNVDVVHLRRVPFVLHVLPSLGLVIVDLDSALTRRAWGVSAQRKPAIATLDMREDILAASAPCDTQGHLDMCLPNLVRDSQDLLREVVARLEVRDLGLGEVNGRRCGSQHVLETLERCAAGLRAQVAHELVLQLRRQAAKELRVDIEVLWRDRLHQVTQLSLGGKA